jgi:rubrerythrin
MNQEQMKELMLQSIEHERGGVKLYEAALTCAVDDRLRAEWERYLEETETHVTVLEDVARVMNLDVEAMTPGRRIVKDLGASLLGAIQSAADADEPQAAQIVACECVVLAETKDHANWQLLGKCAKELSGPAAEALKGAYEEIEDQEDEHLYHTKGWCRELWVQSLGLVAVLPPPEEKQHVKTAIGAARAEQQAELIR